MNIKQFIQALPKAELHVHIEGTFEPELMFEIAKRNHIAIPYENVDAVRQAYDFHNLQSFLDIYYASAGVLLHEADFYNLTARILSVAAKTMSCIRKYFSIRKPILRGA